MAEHGSPYTRLQRAIRSGNLPLIQATASELGWVPLRDALAILLVIDAKAEERFDAAAVRWVGRLALEVRELTLKEMAGAIESLVALPDENAQRSLLALTERAVAPEVARQASAALQQARQRRRRGLLS